MCPAKKKHIFYDANFSMPSQTQTNWNYLREKKIDTYSLFAGYSTIPNHQIQWTIRIFCGSGNESLLACLCECKQKKHVLIILGRNLDDIKNSITTTTNFEQTYKWMVFTPSFPFFAESCNRNSRHYSLLRIDSRCGQCWMHKPRPSTTKHGTNHTQSKSN